jgi:quercetin dioxygenase-like cupin family protein
MKGLTLEQAADSVGLSPSFLSMVERERADISLQRFCRLASFYGIRPSELLLDEDSTGMPARVLPDEGLFIDRGPGVRYRLLPNAPFGIQVIHVQFQPRSQFQDVLAHKGEDFCWVIEGEVDLLYGGETYRVATGEAISYSAQTPHSFRNPHKRSAEIVAFVTPPYWW